MSASGGLGDGVKDLFEMAKPNMRSKKRLESANLRSEDIQGKKSSAIRLSRRSTSVTL